MARVGDEAAPFRFGIGDGQVQATGRGAFAHYEEGFGEAGDGITEVRVAQRFDPLTLDPLAFGEMPLPGVAEEMLGAAADQVAIYRPYHEYREAWGIFVYEKLFVRLASSIGGWCGTSGAVVAPFVLRQVIAHEQVRFAWEVAGTEIEDVLGYPAYRPYLHIRRDGPTPWTSGRLEEAVASAAEVAYARRVRRSAPALYPDAVDANLAHVGPPYADWRAMRHHEPEIRAAVATLIAGHPDRHMGRWASLTAAELRSARVCWVGNPLTLSSLAARRLREMPPARATFERCATEVMGATLERDQTMPAQGLVRLGGRVRTYATAPDWLLAQDAEQMARLFGANSVREFHRAVREGRPLPRKRPPARRRRPPTRRKGPIRWPR
jgi:hypothetical protein